MRGIIALDIDGTLTNEKSGLPKKTIAFLSRLATDGWCFIFITGRPFASGFRALQDLPFPYFLAVQNGAIILNMPKREIIGKKYLDHTIFLEMDAICHKQPSDFVIYGGFEHDDHCYFRPHRFSQEMSDYLARRVMTYKEVWHPLESYESISIERFPSIKMFGTLDSAREIAGKIEQRLKLHVPICRDPFGDGKYYVIQATHPEISKGQAIADLIAHLGKNVKVIAAGDDYNDIPMLAVADVSIVMETAPEEVLKIADIVALPASQEGIICALEAAIRQCDQL